MDVAIIKIVPTCIQLKPTDMDIVEGVQFETESFNQRFAYDHDIGVIYIESLGLSITSDGGVSRSEGTYQSKQTQQAEEAYRKSCRRNNATWDNAEYERIMRESEKASRRPIIVARASLDELCKLEEEHTETMKKASAIREKMREVAQGLFK